MDQSLLDVVTATIESGKARLPVFDRNAARAQEMLADGRFDVDEIEKLVASDPGLSSALLRAANSTFYGGLQKVVTIREAVMRLGARRVSELVVLASQRQNYRMRDPLFKRLADALWRHSVACALGSQWLAARLRLTEIQGEAALAGLLHDVGKLFLLTVMDDLKVRQPEAFDPSEAFAVEVTRALHAEQGERLLGAWNIPDAYARVVRHHHDEQFDDHDLLLVVVRLVDQTCNHLGIGLEPAPGLQVAGTLEAQLLRTPDVLLAELEIQIEDAMEVAAV